MRPKGLSCSSDPRSRDIQGLETFLETSGDKKILNFDTEWSNQPPSLSALSSNWLSRSMIKCWAICTNLPVNVTVRLPHPPGGDSQDQETFSASCAYERTHNYDIECSNHRPSRSTLRPKELSYRNIKWWAMYINLPVNIIVRLPDPCSGASQGQKKFLESLLTRKSATIK